MNSNEFLASEIHPDSLAIQSCPFCQLYNSEVGLLNAGERDLSIFSLHIKIDHGFSIEPPSMQNGTQS